MPNQYYNYNNDLTPFSRIRSQDLDDQFQAIEAGFDLISGNPGGGDDSGGPNTPIIDPGGDPEDGDIVTFRPAYTNTGPTTIVVRNSAAKPVLRNNGAQLQAGDLIAGVSVALIYEEPNDRWILVGATAVQAVRPPVKVITGSYTLTSADEGSVIVCSSASNISVTIPAGLPVGYIVHLYRYGVGEVIAVAGAGVVLRTALGARARAQYSSISPACTATDDFMLLGDATD